MTIELDDVSPRSVGALFIATIVPGLLTACALAIGLMVIISKLTTDTVPGDIRMKMLVLHAPEKLGLKQEYIQEHQHGH